MTLPLKIMNTPALVIQSELLKSDVASVKNFCDHSGSKFLYALKPQTYAPVLEVIANECSGFAASSMFETQLTKEISSPHHTTHFTSPGLRPEEVTEISALSDYVSFNSLTQWDRFSNECFARTKCGLRINPHCSFVEDERYNPCKTHSKLGASIDHVVEQYGDRPERFKDLTGIHIHTNCDSEDFSQLDSTVELLEDKLKKMLHQIEWINLGGGYLFKKAKNLDQFYEAVERLKGKYKLEVFIEPGAAVVRQSGSIISSVIDLFTSDGKAIAVLDTTVSHMPEVFEYQFEPDVADHKDDGEYEYILAGASCLGGDVFGEYAFDEPLQIGSKLVFQNMGAYTNVKAHMFNGINLPSIYTFDKKNGLILQKEFTYSDFCQMNGVKDRVYI